MSTWSFLVMWTAMMVPMMLPALVPMLGRYRRAVAGTGAVRLAWLTGVVAIGYFLVWAVLGIAARPLSIGMAALSRAIPITSAVVVLIAGALQFSAWKARRLACCREDHGRSLPSGSGVALQHGLTLGAQCGLCCGNLMLMLLAIGVMNLGGMAVVTAAITAERLAPAGQRVARGVGAVAIAAAVYLIAATAA
jgi:predicted metal-binding membrane protein